ncbi:hypothetical protein ACJO2E_12740 [Marinobacter sp. M1N3S26]|uniref:hypothetical protein n=1 Tax=Marinobacter sp. M1N3S26 TaxID=3382299 RepID=UPI00387AAE54
MPDVIIPIVFPDYKITVNTPPVKIGVPDLLPFVDIFPNEVRVPHTENKLDNLGHAGILFINGRSGLTKYYEYGRYDPNGKGWVKKIRNLPDVTIGQGGSISSPSLTNVLRTISGKSGKDGRISGAYIEMGDEFDAVLEFAQGRMALNSAADREPYNLVSYSCVHFMEGALKSAGLDTPWMLDPRPVSYILEIQDDYPPLEYSPKTNRFTIGRNENAVGQ